MRAAIALVGRAELRRRRGSLIVLMVLVGVVVSLVLATAAGARRTASVLDRFRDETAARDLQATVESPDFVLEPARVDALRRRLAALDGVSTVSALTFFPVAVAGTPFDFGIMTSPDGGYFASVDRPIVVDGRLPAVDSLDEIALTESAVTELGLDIGDRLSAPTYSPPVAAGFVSDRVTTDDATGPTIEATVVGIVRMADELSVDPETATPGAVASPAWFGAHSAASGSVMTIYALRVDRSIVSEDEVRAIVRGAVGEHESYVSWVEDDYVGELRSAHRSLATGLVIAAVIAALAGVLTIVLAINRQMTIAAGTASVMRGLGIERRQRAVAMAMPSALAVVTGTAVGVLGAAALSPLFPLSVARRAEVAPGFDVDAILLSAGGAAFLAVLLAGLGVGALRVTARRVSVQSRPVVSAGRVLRRAGPPAALGVTMTLEAGATPRGVPARSAVAGAVVGVAGAVGVLVFLASVSAGREEAYRYGWAWHSSPNLVSDDPEAAVTRIAQDPELAAVADVSCGPVDLDALQLYACAFNNWKGATTPPTVAGRPPVAAAEVALGRATMRRLGVGIGDTVRTARGDELTVVGETVIPMLDNSEPGQGAIMTLDALQRQRLADGGRYLLLTYAADTDHPALERRLEADYGVSFAAGSRPEPPARLLQLDLMTGLLRSLGAFLVALGVVGLVHVLAVSARRRRHDFGVLRALGFVRRDVSATMSWQAVTVAVVGAVVGAPLGVLLGRWAWLSAIGSVGMIDTPVLPRWALAAVVAIAVGGSAAIGAVPGWFAARRPPAEVLRAE